MSSERPVARRWRIVALGSMVLLALVMLWPDEPEQAPALSTEEDSRIAPIPRPTGAGVNTAPDQPPTAPRSAPSPPTALAEPTPESDDALSPSRTSVRLYADARVRPIYDLKTNEVEGVQILQVEPGSFWQEIGVQSHDTILELNGELIDSPNATVALMNALSRGYVLSLRIRDTDGRERFIDYRTPE